MNTTRMIFQKKILIFFSSTMLFAYVFGQTLPGVKQNSGPPIHPEINDISSNIIVKEQLNKNEIQRFNQSGYGDLFQEIIINANNRDGNEQQYVFTNCGQTGRYGPSQSQVNNSYSGNNPLSGLVTVSNGIQQWIVPSTGTYVIEAYGAKGGPGANYAVGDPGNGAYMTGTFQLQMGDVIQILVGQKGSYTSYSNSYGGGGGGGTYVAIGNSYGSSEPLIIAGGGGGGGYNSSDYVHGQTGTSGSNGGNASNSNYNNPGVGGNNGMGATGSTYGGNAGGFYSDGSGNHNHFNERGIGFRYGGNGGNGEYGGHGGFGGGGGGYGGAGGGGGYSGGGGGAWSYGGAGGGGGSFNSGTNQTNISGTSNDHGLVVITSDGFISNHIPVAEDMVLTSNEDEMITITLQGSDVDEDELTYSIHTVPNNGSVTINGNIVTYSPNGNFHGNDDFKYTVSDGEHISQPAEITIQILSVNDLPTFSSLPALDIMEGTHFNYTMSIDDVDGDQVSVSVPTKPNWLTINDVNSNSLFFNGNDYVTIPYSPNQDIVDEMTIEAWVLIDNYQDYGAVITKGTNGYSEVAPFSLMQGYGGHMRLSYNFNGSPSGNFFTNSVIPLDTWTHIACVVQSDGAGYFYINGSLDATYNFGNNFEFHQNDEILTIGADPPGNTEWWYGNIDEIRLWNRARTVDQINIGMNQSIDSNQDGLIAYWNFNEGSGNQLHDQTGNGNNGTITGADWSANVGFSTSIQLSGTPDFHDGGLHEVEIIADDGNGGTVNQSFSISVSVAHMEITGESGFRILSSPVSGAIFGDLLEELWTQGAEGSDHEGADPNVWTYENGWVAVDDLNNDVLSAGEGFVIYVFSDTDYDGDDDLPVTIGIDDSTLNQNDITVSSNPGQWNLIGNPYGLSVDVSQMLNDNNSKFNSTVYKLDHVNPGYRTHNGIVGDVQDGAIKPFEGFWIQAGSEGNQFEFTESAVRKGYLNSDDDRRNTDNESTGSATFTFSNGEFNSSVYISFSENGHINLDPADSKRIIPMSPSEHLTSMIYESNKSLSINNLPYDLSHDITFGMDIMLLHPNGSGYETQSENIDLTWDIVNLPENITLSLINNLTGQSVNLYGFPSSNVSLPSKGGFPFPTELMETYPAIGESLFSLLVNVNLESLHNEGQKLLPNDITLYDAYPNPFNPSTIINFDIKERSNVSLDIFDLKGRKVASLINEVMMPGNHKTNWNPGLLPSGVYIVELRNGKKSLNQKITYIK